ncbi:MAG: iron-sulfur cluster assembly accessory protein [Candidatus Aenigmatarchaeota archaeon]
MTQQEAEILVVTKSMTIGEVIQTFPKSSEIMLEYGLHCVGCHVNPYESIEAGARGHGLDDKVIDNIVNDINKAITAEREKFKNQDSKTDHKHEPGEDVTLTAKAAEKLKVLLKEQGKEEYGIRLGVLAGGCAGNTYDMDFEKEPADNDIVIEAHGLRLFVSPESMELLKGIEVDYVETLQQSGFKFNNPNASASCGCGKSFG